MKSRDYFNRFVVMVIVSFVMMICSIYGTYVRQEITNPIIYLVALYVGTAFFFTMAGWSLSRFIASANLKTGQAIRMPKSGEIYELQDHCGNSEAHTICLVGGGKFSYRDSSSYVRSMNLEEFLEKSWWDGRVWRRR